MSANPALPYLVDSHCHLDRLSDKTHNGNLDAAIEAARDRGVRHFLCIGVDMESWPQVEAVSQSRPFVHASVGVHPLYKDSGEPTVGQLVEVARNEKVVAIGETGLDYFYAKEDNQWQQQRFITHIQAARKTGLPLIVHTRGARQDTIDLLRQYGEGQVEGVLHCFTEDLEMAQAAIEMGFYISISGIVTFRNATALQEVVRALPMDRLLVETDSPWLAPVPHRGKPNEPAWVYEVAQCIADLKQVPLSELAHQTSKNYFSLFKRIQPVEPLQ